MYVNFYPNIYAYVYVCLAVYVRACIAVCRSASICNLAVYTCLYFMHIHIDISLDEQRHISIQTYKHAHVRMHEGDKVR